MTDGERNELRHMAEQIRDLQRDLRKLRADHEDLQRKNVGER